MAGPQPKAGIIDIARYVGGEASVRGVERIIKLASNESPLGPSPRAMAAYRDLAADLHRYPDGSAAGLRAALARQHGLDAERIVCGNGSDELLSLIGRAYVGPGDEVLCSRHGFLMYPIVARAEGASLVMAPETDLTADVDALLARVSERTRLVFIANPNNPTGTFLSHDALARLHAGLPADVILVIDSAYAEYVARNDYDPGTALAAAHGNVVMTRTFSKIYGLAALRVGWAYCPPDVADVLNRIRGPFNVSSAALAAAAAALADTAHTDRARTNNDIVLPWFAEQCRGLGLEVNPSVGNFVIVRFPSTAGRDAAAAYDYLCARGIIGRRIGAYGLAEWLRFTIGREDEMQTVVDAIAAFLGTDA